MYRPAPSLCSYYYPSGCAKMCNFSGFPKVGKVTNFHHYDCIVIVYKYSWVPFTYESINQYRYTTVPFSDTLSVITVFVVVLVCFQRETIPLVVHQLCDIISTPWCLEEHKNSINICLDAVKLGTLRHWQQLIFMESMQGFPLLPK